MKKRATKQQTERSIMKMALVTKDVVEQLVGWCQKSKVFGY